MRILIIGVIIVAGVECSWYNLVSLLSFFFLQEGDSGCYFCCDFRNLAVDQLKVLIDDGLVGLVHLWQCEEGDKSQNQEGKPIKPAANVRE